MRCFAIAYKGSNNTVVFGEAHTEVECAIESIPVFEGSQVLGLATIDIDNSMLPEGEVVSGLQFRLNHAKRKEG
jgi:hypothetical protein